MNGCTMSVSLHMNRAGSAVSGDTELAGHPGKVEPPPLVGRQRIDPPRAVNVSQLTHPATGN